MISSSRLQPRVSSAMKTAVLGGIQQYRITVGLWTRGILKEHHGIDYSTLDWVTSEPEGAGYKVPNNIKLELQGNDLESLLLSRELDALYFRMFPGHTAQAIVACGDCFRTAERPSGLTSRKPEFFPSHTRWSCTSACWRNTRGSAKNS